MGVNVTGIPLFIAEPTGTCLLSLRRFCYGEDASGHYHDASAVIDDNAPCTPRLPDGRKGEKGDRVPPDDPRWPTACDCGEPFAGDDKRQVNEIEWYEGSRGRFAWGSGSWDGIPGAMIRSPWRDNPGRPPSWTVFLPNGSYWNTNDPSSGDEGKFGPCWEVTGDAPLITVSPSIDDRDPSRPWHGWIRDGELVAA
jgi:hypothetical protein